ncbi:MAG TPA: M20 family metallopeptidase [Thermoanaerobaculia bacterium]|nr:M20 family metallopeptidase [Thermoanaerobaculia bacterium]
MREIFDYLRARQEEMVALARELAVIESPSNRPETQGPVFDRLAAALEDAGLRTRRLPGRTSGGQLFAAPARPRQSGAQLVVGHVDTVWPVGTLAEMPVELRDGRLHGPGVYDMKAGLVQGVYAVRALRDLGLEPPLAPVFFVNSDEEVGSPESVRWIRRLARRVRRVFVLEPSLGPEGRLKTARKGVLRYRVTIRGRAAHAGLEPEAGASAVQELAHVVRELYALAAPERGMTVNIGLIGGGQASNVVAPEAWAEVDLRVLHRADAEAFERAFYGLTPEVPGTKIEIAGGMNRQPLEPNSRNRALWQAAERCAGELGIELGEGTAGGGSDGNFTSEFVATLDGLGAVGDGAHAVHEHVVTARMPERAALLAGLMLEPV